MLYRLVFDRFVMRSWLLFDFRFYLLVLLRRLHCLGFNLKFLLSFNGLGGCLVLSRLMLHWLMLDRLVFNRLMLDWFVLDGFMFNRLMLNRFMLGDLLVFNRLNLMRFLLNRLCLFLLLLFLLSLSMFLLALFYLLLLLVTRFASVFFIGLFELFGNISNSGPFFSMFLLLSS